MQPGPANCIPQFWELSKDDVRRGRGAAQLTKGLASSIPASPEQMLQWPEFAVSSARYRWKILERECVRKPHTASNDLPL